MAKFYCSVLFPPERFVNRMPVDATCMYEAFLKIRRKFKPLNRFDPLYKIEYCGHSRYFNINGDEVK